MSEKLTNIVNYGVSRINGWIKKVPKEYDKNELEYKWVSGYYFLDIVFQKTCK